MEQNTNPTPQQPQGNQGFDFSKISMQNKILAGLGLAGAISTFLPLTKPIPFFGAPSILNAFEGVISLILYLGLIAICLFGSSFKIEEKLKAGLPKYISYGVAGFAFILLIRMLTNSMPFGFLGFGFYVFIIVAILTVLFTHDVIKVK